MQSEMPMAMTSARRTRRGELPFPRTVRFLFVCAARRRFACGAAVFPDINSPYKFETISRAASPGGTGASRCCLSGLTFTGRVYIISVLSLCIHNYRACGAYPQARFCVRAGHALSDLGNRSAISGAVKAESARYRPDLRGLIRFWMRVNCSKAYSIRFMGDRNSWIK